MARGFAALFSAIALAACSDDPPPLGLPSGTGGGDSGGSGGSAPSEGILSASVFSTIETDPQIAVSSNGVVAIVWSGRIADGASHVGWVFSDDGGASWTEPQVLVAPDDDSYLAPDVVADNLGTFWLTFLSHERSGEGAQIYLASSNGTAGFGAPSAVSDETMVGFYGRPRVAITNGGKLLVAYTQIIQQIAELVVATRSLSGDTFQRTVLTQGGAHYAFPQPCAAFETVQGRAYVTALVQGRVGLWRTADEGMTWNAIDAFAPGDQGQIGRPPSCEAVGNRVWVSYGIAVQGGLKRVRVGTSGDGGETMAGWGTVSDPAIGPRFAVHQLAIEPPDTGHMVYYAGAGIGDEAGSARQVTFGIDDLPAPPAEPPDPPPDPDEEGLTSAVVHEPITFQLVDTNTRWLGDSLGLAYHDGELLVAYVDNAGQEAHVAFAKVSP